MMRYNLKYLLALLFFVLFAGAELHALTKVLNVGILRDTKPSKVIITPANGSYHVYADGEKILELSGSKVLQLSVVEGAILAETLSGTLGTFSSMKLLRKKWGASYKIKSVKPKRAEKEFNDNLIVTVEGNHLLTVNNVYIEHYVAGVVESEAGANRHEEYYKVQVIICRTYALSNLRRHEAEGFQLCDRVHCQVYKGRCRFNSTIKRAALATRGYVLVDSDINLITASFHSNCGGKTANSEDVWKYPLSYLKAKEDTFCLQQPHARWEKEIPKSNWLGYLKNKYDYPVGDSLQYHFATHYQPLEREVFFTPCHYSILIKATRKDWQLATTFFSIEQDNGSLLFKGAGYGHGVGLCQEGAMRMAELGYAFTKVLHYYYRDVHLIDLAVIDFFRGD